MLTLAIAVAICSLTPIPLHTDSQSAEAWTGCISLPLTRADAETLYSAGASPQFTLNGRPAASRAVGWWDRDRIPRRVLLYHAGDSLLGGSVTVEAKPGQHSASGASPWSVTDRPFKTHPGTAYKPILRGGSNQDSFSEYEDLVLAYKGKEMFLRMGTRRDKFHDSATFQGMHDWWQWTRIETILDTEAIKLVRVGGLLYNEDTFLHCDLFLELYGNGVARAYAHFVNARVIGDGYDYFGIPVLAFGGVESPAAEIVLDGTQTRFPLGAVRLDIQDSVEYVSADHPGRIYAHEGFAVYQPWQDQRVTDKNKTFGKEFVTDIGQGQILRGLARTVRFTFSLSDAPPRVARMLAPSWHYAMARELWHGEYLPAEWRFAQAGYAVANRIAQPDPRYTGTFEAGYSDTASEGYGGSSLLFSAMQSGDLYHLERGLAYAYCWADIMVDHVDWSVRQPFTGYYWKTPPYTKFLDLARAYVETGDPYLLETAEHCANAYFALIRSTWPSRSIGRGVWPVTGQTYLYEFTRNPYYLECGADLVKKALFTFEDPARLPGHQIGVGPNGIGNLNTPDGRGYADLVLCRSAIEVALSDDGALPGDLRDQTLRDTAEVLRMVIEGIKTKSGDHGGWLEYETDMLIVTMLPLAEALEQPEWASELEPWLAPLEDYLTSERVGRPYQAVTGRPYYDSVTLNAQWDADGLLIDPALLPDAAAGRTATVQTPAGRVSLRMRKDKNGEWLITPKGKPACPVRVEK